MQPGNSLLDSFSDSFWHWPVIASCPFSYRIFFDAKFFRGVHEGQASEAIAKANMTPPQSWKEFDVADRAARRAAGLENAEVVQQTLIHINDEGLDSEVIDLNLVQCKEWQRSQVAGGNEQSISTSKSVLGRIGRKFGVALSAGDFGFCLNFTLEFVAARAMPFVTRRDQVHGFLWFSSFAHLIWSRDDFVVIRVRGREQRPIGDFEEDSAPNSPTHFE
jgi:hypothetical protein